MGQEALHRGRRVPDVLTCQEQIDLLAAPNRGCPTGLRNYWMLRLMLDLGLRSGEVRALAVQDIDWITARLVVRRGKGGRDRTLWLSAQALEDIAHFRERRQPPHAALLFTTLHGGPVSERYLRAATKRLAARAGIAKDVHPHTLRHSFGTDLYRRSGNLRITQKALGHASISTTQIYTHICDEELEAALRDLRA